MIFIIKSFRTIVFIFVVISTTFRLICPPAFFRCLSNSGTFRELRTTSFIESTRVVCSDSASHNRVQVLSIPVLSLTSSQDWTCNLQMIVSLEALGTNANNRYAMCPKPLMIKVFLAVYQYPAVVYYKISNLQESQTAFAEVWQNCLWWGSSYEVPVSEELFLLWHHS